MLEAERKGEFMTTQKKAIPTFSNEQKEREFWATHDSTEYVEWDKAASAIFAELKQTINMHFNERNNKKRETKIV
jgi:hypothetical protein